MDVLGDVAWHQTHIVMAQKSTGRWAVEVEREGMYRFSMRRWPEELELAIDGAVPAADADSHIYAAGTGECRTISPTSARLSIFDLDEVKALPVDSQEIAFEISISRTGETHLEAWFLDAAGDTRGAYYVTVERLAD